MFPEGTTSDGVALLPFHANLIQAAISAGAPAQPVALQFVDAATGAASLTPCYIGDDTLVGSLWRTLSGSAGHGGGALRRAASTRRAATAAPGPPTCVSRRACRQR